MGLKSVTEVWHVWHVTQHVAVHDTFQQYKICFPTQKDGPVITCKQCSGMFQISPSRIGRKIKFISLRLYEIALFNMIATLRFGQKFYSGIWHCMSQESLKYAWPYLILSTITLFPREIDSVCHEPHWVVSHVTPVTLPWHILDPYRVRLWKSLSWLPPNMYIIPTLRKLTFLS